MTSDTNTPQEAGLDLLEKDFGGSTQPDISATQETEKLESTETPSQTPAEQVAPETVKTETEPAKETEPEPAPAEFVFKDPEPEEGTWKTLIESLGYQAPEDFSEEKGYEVLKSLKEKEVETRLAEVQAMKELDIISQFPEPVQAEAKLVLDLLKTGQTLEQINAPLLNIKNLKSLAPEQLVRTNIEGLFPNWDAAMVDSEMEKMRERGTLDIEYKKLVDYLNLTETQIIQQRQTQITNYQNQQAQIREQKRQQDLSSVKSVLDRTTAFMDTKLGDEQKKAVLNDLQGWDGNMSAQDKVDFMLWKKYGKQGMQFLQSRAIEKAQLELAKKQHNIPQDVAGAGGNRPQTTYTTGIDQLEADFNRK